jgi:pentatricopeptide repeat protein
MEYLHDVMTQSKVETETITFNAAISACERGGAWEEALQLFNKMASMQCYAH